MAHFARIDTDNIVQRVAVVDDENVLNESGVEEEAFGIAYLNTIHGVGFTWVQTSYNTVCGVHSGGGTPFRKNYAGKGYTYDKTRDAFIPPKLFASWTLDEDTCNWVCPVSYPDGDGSWDWNDDTQAWDKV